MAVLINDWGSPGSSLSIDGRGLFAWREQGRKIPGNFSNLLICLVVCSATCKKYALKEAIWNTQHNKSMVIPLILRDVVASCQFPTNCIVQQTIIQNISFFPFEYKYLCGPSTCKVIALDLFCTVGAGRRPLNTSLALSNLNQHFVNLAPYCDLPQLLQPPHLRFVREILLRLCAST